MWTLTTFTPVSLKQIPKRQAAEIRILSGETEIVLQTKEGMFLRFMINEIPELKKNSRGVRGMKLEDGDMSSC